MDNAYTMDLAKLLEMALYLNFIWSSFFSFSWQTMHFNGVMTCLYSLLEVMCRNKARVYLKEEDPSDQQKYKNSVGKHVKNIALGRLLNPIECLCIKGEVAITMEISNSSKIKPRK